MGLTLWVVEEEEEEEEREDWRRDRILRQNLNEEDFQGRDCPSRTRVEFYFPFWNLYLIFFLKEIYLIFFINYYYY